MLTRLLDSMGNNPTAGFVHGEGATPSEAVADLCNKVEARGGRISCDEKGVCYTVDANGMRFRIHITPLAADRGVKWYSATQGVAV